MKILVLMGNPRKNGYTRRLGDLLLKGLRGGKAEVEVIDLTRKEIRHCTGCYSCWLVHPGVCIHKDDMPEVMRSFCASDMVVVVSPLCAYGPSSHIKVFFDRVLTYTKEGFVPTANGLIRNTVRDPEHWPHGMAYMLVGAFRGAGNFEGAQKMIELFAHGIDIPLCGGLIRPESYLLQFDLAKPKTIKTIEAAFEQAGLELANGGGITPLTAERAATPLSADLEHFQKYANIYWEHARSMGAAALDVSAVREKVVGDMRVLLSEMVRSVDSVATARVRFSLQFDFTDTARSFVVSVDKGMATLTSDKTERPDLRITTTTTIWAGVFMRRVNVRDALVSGSIVLAGDKSIFSKIDRYFPPPAV